MSVKKIVKTGVIGAGIAVVATKAIKRHALNRTLTTVPYEAPLSGAPLSHDTRVAIAKAKMDTSRWRFGIPDVVGMKEEDAIRILEEQDFIPVLHVINDMEKVGSSVVRSNSKDTVRVAVRNGIITDCYR